MSDYTDRAYVAAEQAGARCEVPPHTYVPLVRHHPEVLRRQLVAQRHATGEPWWAPFGVIAVMAALLYAASWCADMGGL